jgi:hypothetical protein
MKGEEGLLGKEREIRGRKVREGNGVVTLIKICYMNA